MFSDIFTGITSAVKEFSDWAKPVTDAYKSVSPLVDAAVTGYGQASSSAKQRQQTAQQNSNVGGNMQSVSQQFDPGTTGYGLQQFAGDAAAVENRWKQILTQFVNPEQVK